MKINHQDKIIVSAQQKIIKEERKESSVFQEISVTKKFPLLFEKSVKRIGGFNHFLQKSGVQYNEKYLS